MRKQKRKKEFNLPTHPKDWEIATQNFLKSIKIQPNGCWIWTKYLNSKGYGGSHVFGKRDYAHRISWILFNRRLIPDGLMVLHKCKIPNPACVNPSHLQTGTAKENTADMMAQGRNAYVIPIKYGTEHPQARLTEDQVREIRSRNKSGESKTSIGLSLNVSRKTIAKIIKGETWGWLK